MDIQSLSVDLSRARLQEQAAVQVQAMAVDTIKEQAAAVEKLVSAAQVITDPNVGQYVDISV